ncbi:MAG: hypothetical protein WD003_00375 [Candidatus Paceibacterota bacterium]
MRRTYTQKGYVLLLSVLISGIILAIGVGIANITIKGLILASTGKNSQYAFYAADSGGECALYWDINGDGSGSVFATSSESTPPTSGIECSEQDIAESWNVIDTTPTTATTVFVFNITGGGCTQVFVKKTNSGGNTDLEAHGLSSCLESARRVERVLKVSY